MIDRLLVTPQSKNPPVDRGIALFPGAFRPPHAAHMAAVLSLLERPDVDEVVIIIANRSRLIPGTTLALGAETAASVWAIYLSGLPIHTAQRIQIEIAHHAAVDHALAYCERAAVGDRLLFCLGQADFGQGDQRFDTIETMADQHGISAQVIAAPTGDYAIRATDLRHALNDRIHGFTTFEKGLPPHLSLVQRTQVWKTCRGGMRERRDLILERVQRLLNNSVLGEVQSLIAVSTAKVDPVIRVRFSHDQSGSSHAKSQAKRHCAYVKYAGDTVSPGTIGDRLSPKPRKRLATERRALRRLHKLGLAHEERRGDELPQVLLFDKESRMLVLSQVCPGGWRLQNDLMCGIFDPIIAASIGRFLAHGHNLGDTIKPVWGSLERDTRHWNQMLSYRTVALDIKTPNIGLEPKLRGGFHGEFPRGISLGDS